MNYLPFFFQPDSSFRPWALALTACLFACLPRASRRLGGTLLIVLAGVWGFCFFVNAAYQSYAPSP